MLIFLIPLAIIALIIFGFLKAIAGIIDEIRHPPGARANRAGNKRAVQPLRREQESRYLSGSTFNEYGEIANQQRILGFNRHGEIEQ